MVIQTPSAPAARPLAFVSDVHGNLEALDAVLAELERRGVEDIFVAGDLLFGGDEPLEVWRRLQQVGARCTRGMSDTALVSVDPESLAPKDAHERDMAERFQRTRATIGELVLEQLKRLPERLRIPLIDGCEVVMVHGSPADATLEISHDLDDAEIVALVQDDPADWVMCGSTHVPFLRELDGVHVVNLGSVGDAPEGKVAHFTILTPRMDGTQLLQTWVEY